MDYILLYVVDMGAVLKWVVNHKIHICFHFYMGTRVRVLNLYFEKKKFINKTTGTLLYVAPTYMYINTIFTHITEMACIIL